MSNNKLKTGHPDNGRHSRYRAIVVEANNNVTYCYSLPEYRDMELQKLKEYIEKRFQNIEKVLIYSTTDGRTADPLLVLNAERGQWQPYDDYQRYLTQKAKRQAMAGPKQASKLTLWLPLNIAAKIANNGFNKTLHSVDVDMDTAEVYSDYQSAQTLIDQFYAGGWDEKVCQNPAVYRTGEKQPIAYLSLKHGKIFYHQTVVEFGRKKMVV